MHNDPTIERILDCVDSTRIERNRAYEAEQARRNSLFIGHDEFPPTDSPRFIVDPLIPEGRVILLAGDPKCGKTALATALALAVAKGEPFAGMPVQQGAVLWLSCEESFGERSELLRLAPKSEDPVPIYTCYESLPIDSEDADCDIQHWKNRVGAKLLIVDPLHGATSGRSLHDGWAARKTLRLIKRLCGATGLTAIVIHHLTKRAKRARVAESVQLAAIASSVMILTPEGSHSERSARGVEESITHTAPRLIKLECVGRGIHANRTHYFDSNGPLDYRPAEAPAETPIEPRDTIKSKILTALSHTPATARQLATTLNLNLISVRNAMSELLHAGAVAKSKTTTSSYEITK